MLPKDMQRESLAPSQKHEAVVMCRFLLVLFSNYCIYFASWFQAQGLVKELVAAAASVDTEVKM
jgi:hypothetical protein